MIILGHTCLLLEKACAFSHIQLFVTLRTAACQAPLSMGFSSQEYRSGLPFSLPGDLPDPGVDPKSPASPAWPGRFFTTEPSEKPSRKSNASQMYSHHKEPPLLYSKSKLFLWLLFLFQVCHLELPNTSLLTFPVKLPDNTLHTCCLCPLISR